MKKILSGIVFLVVIAVILTSCRGGDSNSGESKTLGSNTTATGDKKVEKPAAINEVDPANDVRGSELTIANCNGEMLLVEQNKLVYARLSSLDVLEIGAGTRSKEIARYPATCIQYIDGWLYLIGGGDSRGRVQKMKPDGSEVSNVIDNLCMEMVIVNGWMYYTYRPGQKTVLEKCKLDGSEKTELFSSRDIDNISISGSWIYYQNDGIYRMDINGNNIERFAGDSQWSTGKNADDKVFAAKPRAFGKKVYYCEHTNLTKESLMVMDADGSNKKQVLAEAPTYYTIYGDYIYYSDYRSDSVMMRVSINGGQPQKLTEHKADDLFLIAEEKLICYLSTNDGWYMHVMNLDGTDQQKQEF